jgi:hypothetical protein
LTLEIRIRKKKRTLLVDCTEMQAFDWSLYFELDYHCYIVPSKNIILTSPTTRNVYLKFGDRMKPPIFLLF